MADPKPDSYASLVPQYVFSGTLVEQREQLANNPLLKRFAESRNTMADDPHRPIYHYINPEHLMNDPNGLCFWQDRWHLFYQAYPPEDPRQHWGHAVSEDLIHWRDLPYAIYPDPERCCYSGSTFVENDRVIAMYHGTRAGTMVAISDDPLLLNWSKVSGGPVIPMAPADTEDALWQTPDGTSLPYRIHDTCIWKKDGKYFSLSNGTLPGPEGKRVRTAFLFRSNDLEHWNYLHPFDEGDRFTYLGDDNACPYFWPIGNRHILLFASHMSGSQYFIGDYDTVRDKFLVSSHGRFNFGPRYPAAINAPSATPDGEGGIITIFNLVPGKPTTGWDQIMTLPRRLTLTDENELEVRPAGDIESLRAGHYHTDDMILPANEDVVLEAIDGASIEIIAELDVADVPMFEMNVLRSSDGEERTRIMFFEKRGFDHQPRFDTEPRRDSLISIDSSYSSLSPDVRSRAPETAAVHIDENKPLRLHVFVDRSVVEVFVNDRQCLSIRVYPSRGDSTGVSLRAQGRDAVLLSLDSWRMNDIYRG